MYFWGKYYQSTILLPQYCTLNGVSLTTYSDTYRSINALSLKKAQDIIEKYGINIEGEINKIKYIMYQRIDQEMKDTASSADVSISDLCMRFNENSHDIVNELSVSEEIHAVLAASEG